MVRAATILGPNTVPVLDVLAEALAEDGFDVEVVAPPDLGPNMATAVEAVAGLDLVWACGLLTAELVNNGCPIEVVAAPVFSGQSSATYHSVFVVRSEDAAEASAPLGLHDLAGLRVAVNEIASWSGYRAILQEFTAVRGATLAAISDAVGVDMVLSGAHVESIRAVADGRADLAAIDHSIWQWMWVNDFEAVKGLVVVDRTTDWPAPPFSVASNHPNKTLLIEALIRIDQQPPTGLEAIRPTSIEQYRFMPTC